MYKFIISWIIVFSCTYYSCLTIIGGLFFSFKVKNKVYKIIVTFSVTLIFEIVCVIYECLEWF
jgi:Na+/phosphate symporter